MFVHGVVNFARIAQEDARYALACLEFVMRRGGPRRRILVNGSPKSGTMWMVRMMASLPGYRSVGNFKGNHSLYSRLQPGDVVHGHEWYTEGFKKTLLANEVKVVHMVRDPRDQTVSRVFHFRRDKTLPAYKVFAELSNDDAIMMCIEGARMEGWSLGSARDKAELAKSWFAEDASELCVVVRYEDLIENPAGGLQEACQFLGVPVRDCLVQAIAMRSQFERMSVGRRIWKSGRKPGQEDPSSHFRKGIVGDWRNYFTPVHVKRFKEIAGDILVEMGYEIGLDW